MRAGALRKLLNSVALQTVYPNEIIIVDASTNVETKNLLSANQHKNVHYFLVDEATRGLTKQRNFGISKVAENSEIVSFLDDDIVLENDYFEQILSAFTQKKDAIGIGGVAVNENKWKLNALNFKQSAKHFILDKYYINESSRNYLRNLLNLNSDKLPGILPTFSNGRTFSYPLNDKMYPVDLLVGMAMNFRKSIFKEIQFSTYFEGYGLYEDADFSIRALKFGQNYIATSAKLAHYHDSSGRPNNFSYGKMVIRNGWYVWRVKHPNPDLKSRLKWHAISFLLTSIRLLNVITTSNRKEAVTEAVGRIVGWFSLFLHKPKIQK
jgi:GT2 family glycosyltransferase